MTDKQTVLQKLYQTFGAETLISAEAANAYGTRLGLTHIWTVLTVTKGEIVGGTGSVSLQEVLNKYNEEAAVIAAV